MIPLSLARIACIVDSLQLGLRYTVLVGFGYFGLVGHPPPHQSQRSGSRGAINSGGSSLPYNLPAPLLRRVLPKIIPNMAWTGALHKSQVVFEYWRRKLEAYLQLPDSTLLQGNLKPLFFNNRAHKVQTF